MAIYREVKIEHKQRKRIARNFPQKRMADSKENKTTTADEIMKDWPAAPTWPYEKIVFTGGLKEDAHRNLIAREQKGKTVLRSGITVKIANDRVRTEYDSLDEKAIGEEKKQFEVFGGDVIAYKVPEMSAVFLKSETFIKEVQSALLGTSKVSKASLDGMMKKVYRIAALAAKLPLDEIQCLFIDKVDDDPVENLIP